ncbi:MAG: hypothetical protein K0R50_418 [Eubacterium sp.]|jgi:hypothetical protein|nr:hypothetical protein [Eubacterium sp.]
MKGRKPKSLENKLLKVGDICPGFRKGEDGFCKYYTGSKRQKENCFSKCKRKE